MTFTWIQDSGTMLAPDGSVVGTGYAGNGSGLNNPAMQDRRAVGPLPCGGYTIGPLEPVHGHLGTNVAALIPDSDNEMFGRSEFYLHGRKSLTDMDASLGCIVLDKGPRLKVINSPCKRLEVIRSAPSAQVVS